MRGLAEAGLALLLLGLSALAQAEPAQAEAAPRAAAQALAAEIGAGRHPGVIGFAWSVGDAPAIVARAPGSPVRSDIRSATKSITALLLALAVQRGDLRGFDEEVIEHPQAGPLPLDRLLSMRSGLQCDDWQASSPGHEDRMVRRRDWLAFWLALPARGEQDFAYCTGNVIALGAHLQARSGIDLQDYAQQQLFTPLGIAAVQWARWGEGGREVDAGGHLQLGVEELHRIGRLVLDGGVWQGRRLLAADRIEQLMEPLVAVPNRGAQRYGRLWWVSQTQAPRPPSRVWMAWGNGGTYLIVMPELRLVAAFVGSRYNRPEALEPLVWVRDRLLNAGAQP